LEKCAPERGERREKERERESERDRESEREKRRLCVYFTRV
jgi:hypothetical protein